MKNVEITVVGSTLTIKVDLTKDFGLSSTGKSRTVASTGGFTRLEAGGPNAGLALNLNVIKK